MTKLQRHARAAAPLAVVAALLIIFAASCFSAVAPPDYAPKQLMVVLKPDSTDADLQAIANSENMTIVKALPLPNAYLMRWTGQDSVETKMNRTLQYSFVQTASPNHYRRKLTSIPGDPRFSEQWHYTMIKMPQAWDIEQGKDTVVVAVVDDGISLTHPDIMDRLIPGIDVADNDNDPGYMLGAVEAGHGLHVAGTVAATTDNGIGVAGVCWSGVKIMPVKVFSDDAPWTMDDIVMQGLDWAKANGANVVNMSLGGPGYNPAFQAKITELVNAGIVIVAAAGNDGRGPVSYPAAHDGVIAVSAVNRSGLLTTYSNVGPEISVAAPGGEMLYLDDPNGVLSTYWEDDTDTYAFLMGTSMASPHVAGAAAILLSAGVASADVKSLLEISAKPVGASRPNNNYGWGIIDVYKALSTGGAQIIILDPTSGQKYDTMLPRFKLRFLNTKKNTIKIYLGSNVDADGDGIPDDAVSPVIDYANIDSYYNESTGLMDFQLVVRDPQSPTEPLDYPVVARNPLLIDEPLGDRNTTKTYRICVTADPRFGVENKTITSWTLFRVEPRSQPSGLRLASVPYPLIKTATDPKVATQNFFGGNGYKMARWLPASNVYARLNYPSVINDSRASLFPPDAKVYPHDTTASTPPAGLGFWLEMSTTKKLLPDTFVDPLNAYDIPVVAGWNMIGDPFPFKVDWNALMVTYQGKTLTISEAVAAGWLRPALYRYINGSYTYESLPAGTLIPWEGNWVKVLKGTVDDPVVLSVPPVVSQIVTRSSPSSQSTSRLVSDERSDRRNWSINLVAEVGSAKDAQNMIGSSADAMDGCDKADVEAPPSAPRRYVDLSFPHWNWGESSGLYTSDIRAPVGPAKTWYFEVKTDIPNANVRIRWPDMSKAPKDCSLALVDLGSSKRVYLTDAPGYVYRSGPKPGVRKFKLYVSPIDPVRLAMTAAGEKKDR